MNKTMEQRADADTREWVLEVGGSHATAAAIDVDRPDEPFARHSDETIDGGAPRDELLDTIARPAQAALRAASAEAADVHWAVAMPGPFDYDSGVGRFAGVGKFESLRDVDVRQELAHRLGSPPHQIRFVNDAVAYGIGEWAFGAAERVDRLVCIALGTGVGSAFLRDGTPVDHGPDVPPAGEAHRIVWNGAPLEDTVSTRAITAQFARRTGRTLAVKEIAALADTGDDVARSVLAEAMRALGAALSPWLKSFDARHLVVGGSMARSWHLLGSALSDGLQANGDIAVRPSALLDTAPLLGAAAWLRRECLTHPPTTPE
ncbi:ROK family protein [Microbacterium sp. G2-8]|uniref:ROK family protein n=1 Tax=Microbacterium sp. G2-8 TaxID=2842454 RepID=UPI001C8AB7FF|nr:ROK family protein [Microbacterium sp. G2-8]